MGQPVTNMNKIMYVSGDGSYYDAFGNYYDASGNYYDASGRLVNFGGYPVSHGMVYYPLQPSTFTQPPSTFTQPPSMGFFAQQQERHEPISGGKHPLQPSTFTQQPSTGFVTQQQKRHEPISGGKQRPRSRGGRAGERFGDGNRSYKQAVGVLQNFPLRDQRNVFAQFVHIRYLHGSLHPDEGLRDELFRRFLEDQSDADAKLRDVLRSLIAYLDA